MRKGRNYGPWPFSPCVADRRPLQENPWKKGDRVRYHPAVGQPDDGKEYVVGSIGHMYGQALVWLEGRQGQVAAEQLTSADAPREPTAADHLAEARKAWGEMRAAERTLARLAKYQRLSPSMKADRDAAAGQQATAAATLQRILGGAS